MTGKGPRRLADDCFSHDRKRMLAAEALALLRERVSPVVGVEEVAIEQAAGRYLAEPLIAKRAVPGFDNVAIDGFAFAHASLDPSGPGRLAIVAGRSAAGHPWSGRLGQGEAVRVLTGGRLPDGADTALMQEDAEVEDGWLVVPRGLRRGANCRWRGEDMQPGQCILPSGHRLTPQAIGAAAAQGISRLAVCRRLRVALVSTGDELREPGEELPPGMTYDSNRSMLRALLEGAGAEVDDQGVWPDNAAEVEQRLKALGLRHQVIITTGGASRGDEDHVVKAVARLGRLDFWQIAVKPGRPLAFGQLDGAVFVGLPGNPVAAMICFLRFARPVLAVLAGGTWPHVRLFKIKAGFSMTKKAGRREYLRARLSPDPDGDEDDVIALRIEREGSGILTSLIEAEGLIELAEDVTQVRSGDLVPFAPLSGFGVLG